MATTEDEEELFPEGWFEGLNESLKAYTRLGPVEWINQGAGKMRMKVADRFAKNVLARLNKADAFNARLVIAPIPLAFEFQGPDGKTVPLQMAVAGGSIRYIDLDTPDARPDETFPEWFERIFERPFPIPDPGFHCLEENTWATTGNAKQVAGFPHRLELPECPVYRMVGFGGHSTNSYACYFSRVQPRLRIHLRIPFGGYYGDPDEQADTVVWFIKKVDDLAHELLSIDGDDRLDNLLIINNMGPPTIVLHNARGESKLGGMFWAGGDVFEAARKAVKETRVVTD